VRQESNAVWMRSQVSVEAREQFQGRETGLTAGRCAGTASQLTIIDRCFLLVAVVFGLCALVGLVELLSGWTPGLAGH
jgi:hypothetical protein